jgi:hypothetical protein
VVFEHNGGALGYYLQEDENHVRQWYPSFVPENVQEQQTGPLSYDDRPKAVSQPLAFEDWSGGCGFVMDEPGTTKSKVYSYSRGVDASWGQPCLSPKRTAFVGMTEAPTKFYRAPTNGWYALSATNVWRLTAGEWVSVYTAASVPTDIIEYSNTTATYLFLAMGDSTNFIYTTSATFAATTAVVEQATYFTVRGATSTEPVLWAIKTNGFIRSSINPILSANWSNEDEIGNKGQTVTSFTTSADLMWILKEEGIWNFDGTTIGSEVDLSYLKRTGNGKHATAWINGTLFADYGGQVLAIDTQQNTVAPFWEPAHPELNGTVTAMCADLRYLYVFMQNASGNTYIVKIPAAGSGAPHTIAYLPSTTVNAAYVVAANAASPSTTNDILVFGYGAASSYMILPRQGYRPWEDSNCTYDIAGGTLYGAYVDDGAATYNKWLNGARVLAQNASGAQSAVVQYSLDLDDTLTTAVTAQANGLTTARSQSEIEFTLVRYGLVLSTGDAAQSPRVQGIVLDTTPNPPRHRQWALIVKLDNAGLVREGGAARPVSYKRAFSHLQGAVGSYVTYTDYFGTEYVVKVMNVQVKGVTRKVGQAQSRSAVFSLAQVDIAEITENLEIDDPFIWGAASTGAGGTPWSSGYEWSE